MSAERRLLELGLELPPVPASGGTFIPWRQAGSLLFLSGQGPRDPSGQRLAGMVPTVVDEAEAYRRARLVGLQLLSITRAALGSLDKVAAVVKLFGMVHAASDFGGHSSVINGCSDLFGEVFGPDIGCHARSAVGMASLPHGITVEIEAILLVA